MYLVGTMKSQELCPNLKKKSNHKLKKSSSFFYFSLSFLINRRLMSSASPGNPKAHFPGGWAMEAGTGSARALSLGGLMWPWVRFERSCWMSTPVYTVRSAIMTNRPACRGLECCFVPTCAYMLCFNRSSQHLWEVAAFLLTNKKLDFSPRKKKTNLSTDWNRYNSTMDNNYRLFGCSSTIFRVEVFYSICMFCSLFPLTEGASQVKRKWTLLPRSLLNAHLSWQCLSQNWFNKH